MSIKIDCERNGMTWEYKDTEDMVNQLLDPISYADPNEGVFEIAKASCKYNREALSRLVCCLKDKGIVSLEDAYFIANGNGTEKLSISEKEN